MVKQFILNVNRCLLWRGWVTEVRPVTGMSSMWVYNGKEPWPWRMTIITDNVSWVGISLDFWPHEFPVWRWHQLDMTCTVHGQDLLHLDHHIYSIPRGTYSLFTLGKPCPPLRSLKARFLIEWTHYIMLLCYNVKAHVMTHVLDCNCNVCGIICQC